MEYTLGRIGIVTYPTYDNTKTYQTLDLVPYNGGSYIARCETTGHLPTDSQYWTCIAASGVELRTNDTHIQWKYGNSAWTDLIALSELEGSQGPEGPAGPQGDVGPQGPAGQGIAGFQSGRSGSVSLSTSGTNTTITFPQSYSAMPHVVVSLEIAADGGSGVTVRSYVRNWVQSGGKYTGIVVRSGVSAGSATGYVHWYANGTLA